MKEYRPRKLGVHRLRVKIKRDSKSLGNESRFRPGLVFAFLGGKESTTYGGPQTASILIPRLRVLANRHSLGGRERAILTFSQAL